MEIQLLKVKEKLKISGKSISEIIQAINNLKRQNIMGCYDERIIAYRHALEQYKSTPGTAMMHKPSVAETAAIMLFNKDRRFTITE